MLHRIRSYWRNRPARKGQRLNRLRHYWQERTSRRRFIKGALAISGTGAAAKGYMRFWEPGWLEINRHEVPLSQGKPRVRLLHLSDLHASRVVSLEYLRHALQIGLEQQPDLICLTGDYITWKYERYDEYSRVLSILSDAAPTFACLGNHDGGKWAGKSRGYSDSKNVRRVLSNAGITLLHNETHLLEVNNRELNLAGLGDVWNGEFDAIKAFATKPKVEVPTVVLSHNPDTKTRLISYDWQLMLSGHTHGGQVWVPGIGAPFAPVRDKRYVKGLHEWEGRWLHITKGVGNLHGVRLNCRPEVSLLTLT